MGEMGGCAKAKSYKMSAKGDISQVSKFKNALLPRLQALLHTSAVLFDLILFLFCAFSSSAVLPVGAVSPLPERSSLFLLHGAPALLPLLTALEMGMDECLARLLVDPLFVMYWII